MGSLFGITMVQKMVYRGDAGEEWSNTYHFKDPPPDNDDDWLARVTELSLIVKPIIPTTGHIVRAYGYDSDDDHASSVYLKDWEHDAGPLAGTYSSFGTDFPLAGDQAVFAWWRTDRRNSRGKLVYLRKYIHDGFCSFDNPDLPGPGYKTAIETYAAALGSGSTPFAGGLRSRTHDDTITAAGCTDYVTTRTLKRRGKRPLAGA